MEYPSTVINSRTLRKGVKCRIGTHQTLEDLQKDGDHFDPRTFLKNTPRSFYPKQFRYYGLLLFLFSLDTLCWYIYISWGIDVYNICMCRYIIIYTYLDVTYINVWYIILPLIGQQLLRYTICWAVLKPFQLLLPGFCPSTVGQAKQKSPWSEILGGSPVNWQKAPRKMMLHDCPV